MLVLSRKAGESILIGNDIEISVVDISKGVVKLGLEAPKDMQILRQELKLAVMGANIEAGKSKQKEGEALKDLTRQLQK